MCYLFCSLLMLLLDTQEKQRQLEDINQKVDGMHMVEQWQLVQTSYERVIAWQQVGLLCSPAENLILVPLFFNMCTA